MDRRRRVTTSLLVLVALSTSGAFLVSCSGGGSGGHLVPPSTLASQQQAASEAVAASGAMHLLTIGVRQLLAIGNTTASVSFATVTPPPAGTPTPAPTTTVPAFTTATVGDGSTPTPTPTPPSGGNYGDPDGNGIPQDVTLVLATAQFPAPIGVGASEALFTTTDESATAGDNGNYRGGITFAIDASSGLSFGWRRVNDLFRTSYSATHASGGSYDIAADSAAVTSFQTDTSGHGHLCQSTTSWTLHYTPVPGATAAYAPATQPTSGLLSISGGSGFVSVDSTANVFQISMSTTTSLTLDRAACGPSLIRSGRLQFVFGTSGTSTPSVHWAACTATVEGLP